MPSTERRLRIAVQKSGKLSQDTKDLIAKCGLKIFYSKQQLLNRIQELPIDLLMVRDDDIPSFVGNGICDLGIVGKNVLHEEILKNDYQNNLSVKLKLGFSKCRLAIALPQNMEFTGLDSLKGLRIATSYPLTLKDFLQKKGIAAKTVKMKGSVEVAPHLKIAEAICDIVSTGSTLQAHGLQEVTNVLHSQAVLIGSDKKLSTYKQQISARLLVRLKGVIEAQESKYVMLNVQKQQIETITAILPGAESPTIIPLQSSNKVAIHCVCKEPIFWDTMEQLKKAGATSILVMPIEKMIS